MVGYAATVTIRGSAPPVAGTRPSTGLTGGITIASVPRAKGCRRTGCSTQPASVRWWSGAHEHPARVGSVLGLSPMVSVRGHPAAASAGFHFFASAFPYRRPSVTSWRSAVLWKWATETSVRGFGRTEIVRCRRAFRWTLLPDSAGRGTGRCQEEVLIKLCQSPEFSIRSFGPPSPRIVNKPNGFHLCRFAIRYPYLIVVICLITCVVGVTSLVRMPGTYFSHQDPCSRCGHVFLRFMPPEQIETDIGRFERFFTLASGVTTIESRSLPGRESDQSLFPARVQLGDSAVTSIANLAMADLRKLPPGTLPAVVLKFDASSLRSA